MPDRILNKAYVDHVAQQKKGKLLKMKKEPKVKTK